MQSLAELMNACRDKIAAARKARGKPWVTEQLIV
jgi:hypothetical protein